MVFVSCASLVSPVGYSPAAAAAALRVGIAAFAETGYRDANGEPVIGAPLPALPATLRGRGRLAALFQLTLDAIDPAFAPGLSWEHMPLILCSREAERPGASLAGLVAELRLPGGRRLHGVPRIAHVGAGAPSAIQAVAMARRLLADTDAPACLVLGADSLIDARALGWLDHTQRLKTPARTDGVVPGEAACLAVVTREPPSAPHVCVRGLGTATESATVLNEEPFRAEGLKAALQEALREAGLAMHDVDFRLSDVAGESYAFEEVVLAQTRLMRRVRPSQPLWHPADCLGDCGAAAGLVQFAWAAQAFHRGYAPGPVAALHTASPFGPRAAAIVAAHAGATA